MRAAHTKWPSQTRANNSVFTQNTVHTMSAKLPRTLNVYFEFKADVQDFSVTGYEVADSGQPIDVSDDEGLVQLFISWISAHDHLVAALGATPVNTALVET